MPTRIARVRIAKLGLAGADGGLIDWVIGAADQAQSARDMVVGGLKRWVIEYGAPGAARDTGTASQGGGV